MRRFHETQRPPGIFFNTMLVGQAIAESASIFAMVIAMLLLFTKFPANSFITVAVLFSAGLCMGVGAIGSGLGSGFPAGEACKGISRQPGASANIRMTMLIGTAIAQTPSIFALVTSLVLIFSDFSSHSVWPTMAAILGAGLAAGIGAVGSGVGDGLVASAACKGIARQPSAAPHRDQDDAPGAGNYGNDCHIRSFSRFYFDFQKLSCDG